MNIGIITYHRSINYGAILQAYALQKTLVNMGHSPEIIDYAYPRFGVESGSRFLRMRHFVWRRIFERALVGTVREVKSDDFRRQNFRQSAQKYLNSKTLHSDPPLYDAYITGSDQVWNPRVNNNDSSFYLTFAPDGKRRISYAASFGVSQIHEEYCSTYAQWLAQIDNISVREVEGNQIVRELTGRDVEIALDPSLLLDQDEWNKIAAPYESSKPYILCYYMPGDKLVNKSITLLARQISIHTDWRIVCIGQKEYMRLKTRQCSVFDAGPADFLGLFQNASFVVTNSFHGTAFSIIYRKPFLVPINQDLPPKKALTSRISTLLKTLELDHRLLPAGVDHRGKDLVDLDYRPVEPILEREKQRSIKFLKNALKGK